VGQLSPQAVGTLADATTFALVAGFGEGAGTCPDVVATSPDGGSHWSTWSLRVGDLCGSAGAAEGTATLLCSDYGSSPEKTTLLVTRDAGRTWHAYTISGQQMPQIVVAADSDSLWAVGPPGVLWHSTDGGVHWSAMTPDFPVAT